MTEASSSGRVAPKIKSINVQANLLTQRLNERRQVYEACRKNLFMVSATLACGLIVLPWLYSLSTSAARAAAVSEKQVAALKQEVSKLNESAKLVEPLLREREMLERSRGYVSGFVGEFVRVMNAAGDRMALLNMRGDVLGGELKIEARADAEDFRAAEDFLYSARQGVSPEDVGLTSTRRSDTLRKGGVSFEFSKKVRLGQ